MDWTTEAIDRLRDFWAEGHSTAEIGRRMGITKNAVVGKAHRLELSARPSPIRREATAASRPAAAFRQPAAPADHSPGAHLSARPQPPRCEPRRPDPAASRWPAAPAARQPDPAAAHTGPREVAREAPGVASLPLLTVRPFRRPAQRSCCWPMGDPGTAEFRFCSGEAITGKPYCQDHAAVAYVKSRDRREDAA